jgi:predicted nucleic acid-binding protein
MTLVDTNVIVDILTFDPEWLDWSAGSLERCAASGPVLINEVVYAEMSVRATSEADLDQALSSLTIELTSTPKPALFVAGKAFNRYRSLGGQRSGILPDFFIGAHAHVLGYPILTRDVRRYRTYFPDVPLITPTT